jgi:NADH-quinone oxidoreductase subunit J
VVLARSALRAAVYLIAALCCSALLYVLLEAPFVAAMQVLVYAGAIMVLFVFVIMMLNLGPEGSGRPAYLSVAKLLGTLAVVAVVYRLVSAALALGGGPGQPVDGSVKAVGRALLTDYLFGFEALSLLLLVAVVGAVVLGLKRLS